MVSASIFLPKSGFEYVSSSENTVARKKKDLHRSEGPAILKMILLVADGTDTVPRAKDITVLIH